MQKIIHTVMSLLVVITSLLKVNFSKINIVSITQYLVTLLIALVIINFLTWVIHIVVEKALTWYEKRKQRNYSLLTWLGDTNIVLDLYSELQEIKTFDPVKFHDNYELTKQKIKQHYTSVRELEGFKDYLETQTTSQKYASLFNTTQTILLGVIVPTVLTIFNFKNYTSTTVSLNAVLFLVFWLILLNGIVFMSNQIDKMKVLLRLVNECIEETPQESNQ
ncbi:hypothetical protein [Neobacillus mesonae]|uniref:Uncharacterized protein n=1 Tax=Neobacillus mesonae TaxID=1193713 RepID=A0A3T0HT31_9BACI|nr:hypothetical protein [Neobacillus mesonae]AZU60265.1 hypothetical protein CHR53_02710 [Neobacillus mesonae]